MIASLNPSSAEGHVVLHVERRDASGEWVEWPIVVYCSAEWPHPAYMHATADDVGYAGNDMKSITADERQSAIEEFAEEVSARLAGDAERREDARCDAAMDEHKDRALGVL